MIYEQTNSIKAPYWYSGWVELIAPLVSPIISSSIDKIGSGKDRASTNFQAIQAQKIAEAEAKAAQQKTFTIIGVVTLIVVAIITTVVIIKRN